VRRENRDTVLHARVSQEGTLGFYFYPLTMEDLQKLSAYDFE